MENRFYQLAENALADGTILSKILELPVREEISRMCEIPEENFKDEKQKLLETVKEAIKAL